MAAGSYDERPGVPVDTVLLASAVHVPFAATAASVALYGRGCVLLGWVIREAAGTPALAQGDLLDGGSAGGELVAPLSLAASAMSTHSLGAYGVQIKSGLYLSMVAGTLRGTVYIIPNQ